VIAQSSRASFGRRYTISASHRLHTDALSAEENQAAYGKCNNPHGHGHNYIVEVLVSGPVDPETGMVVNMAALDDVVRTRMYLTRVEDWEAVGRVHGEFFQEVRPAATMVVVAKLLNPAWRIEIEMDAVIPEAESGGETIK